MRGIHPLPFSGGYKQLKINIMKKLLFLLAIVIGMMSLGLRAQTTSTNGPKLNLNENSITYVMEDSEDFMRIVSIEKNFWGYDDIVVTTYNKLTHAATEQVVDEKLEGRFLFLTNDGMCNVLQEHINKKTKMLEYRKASFPKNIVKVPKKMEFVPFYSVPLNGMSNAYVRAAFCEDMSKFVIYTVLKTNNWKNPIHHVDVAVFDTEGTLLWHQSQLSNDWFPFEDFLFTNDGTVYLAENGSYLNQYAKLKNQLIVSVFTVQGVENQKITPECESYSCKKVIMQNGDLGIVGVGENSDEGGYSVLTYRVSNEGQVDYTKSDISLSTTIDGIDYNTEYAKKNDKFQPNVFNVVKLNNGKLFLTGEMSCRVIHGTYRDSNIPLYARESHNLFCITLSEDGTALEYNEYPRATLTNADVGDQQASKMNPVDIFEYGGDTYLLYNDHRNNYKGNPQSWSTLKNNTPDQCCVVLSKVEPNGELESTVLYLAKTTWKDPRYIAQQYNHEYYLKILKVSGEGIYYILKHDGEFRLEKIDF